MLFSKLIYTFFEAWAWPLWWRNNGRVFGNIPEEPFIMVANHSSYLDWIMLELLFRRQFRRELTFLAKNTVFTNPLFRWGAVNRRIILVEHPVSSVVMNQCIKALHCKGQGNPILCLFPEGTRSRTGKRFPAHNGAAWIARATGVPIVPTALLGFWEVWPPNQLIPTFQRKSLAIRFLAPMRAEQFGSDKEFIEAAMNEVYKAVHTDVKIEL